MRSDEEVIYASNKQQHNETNWTQVLGKAGDQDSEVKQEQDKDDRKRQNKQDKKDRI